GDACGNDLLARAGVVLRVVVEELALRDDFDDRERREVVVSDDRHRELGSLEVLLHEGAIVVTKRVADGRRELLGATDDRRAEAGAPQPVYGIPIVSRRPWMRPSSPHVPYSEISTTSSGSFESVIPRVAGTSAFDADAISFSSPFGSSCAGSTRAPPASSSRA